MSWFSALVLLHAYADEEPTGALGLGIPIDQVPETLGMIGLDEMNQFVDDDIVAHPGGIVPQPVRDPDRALPGRAATRASLLVRDVADRVPLELAVEMAAIQFLGSLLERGVSLL